MVVLVLGATGFVGPPLIRALQARGAEVVGASRHGLGPSGVALDRREVAQVKALVRDRRIDTVIDLIAYTEADTMPLFDALDGSVARWVMASSGDVYRNYEGLQRKARPAPLDDPLAEGSPLRSTRYPYRQSPRRAHDAADAWMDDYDKIPLEIALQARPGLAGVVLRLPMIFGPGDRQRRFRWLLEPMLAGADTLSVDPAWAAWRTTYGYVDDAADALAAAALGADLGGRIFNIGERDAPDHAEWIRRFARILDWDGTVTLAPAPAGGPLDALDLRYTMRTDTAAFRAACSWSEPVPLDTALQRTVDAERDVR